MEEEENLLQPYHQILLYKSSGVRYLGYGIYPISIGISYLLTILALKFEKKSLLPVDVSKILLDECQTV